MNLDLLFYPKQHRLKIFSSPFLGLAYVLVLPVVLIGAFLFFMARMVVNSLTTMKHKTNWGHTG